MAVSFTNFDTDPIGAALVPWTSRNGGTPVVTPRYGTPAVKTRYLEFNSSAGGYQMMTQNAIDADAARANCDLLTIVNKSQSTSASPWLIARASGTTSGTAYIAILDWVNGFLQIFSSASGALTGLVNTAITVNATADYFFRFNVTGSVLTAKLWLAAAAESTALIATVTNTTIATAGSVGIGSNASAAGQTAAFNFFSVGTGTDIAPTPLTNAQYTAWLTDQTQMREVLLEAQLTGYNAGTAPYTKTVNAYFSKYGFTAKPGDIIPSKYYAALIKTAPTFSQKMPTAFAGLATTGLGAFTFLNQNGVASLFGTEPGLDAMLRVNFQRSFARVLLGAPAWPRYDFRTVIVGRIGKPTASVKNEIGVNISDMSDAFNVPLTTQKYSSGPYSGQYKAVGLYGSTTGYVEPPRIDDVNLVYSLGDQVLTGTISARVYDTNAAGALIPLFNDSPCFISTVTNGSPDLGCSAAHGLLANYKVEFQSSTPPPFATNNYYYVLAAGLTSTSFRLGISPGGAAILVTGPVVGTLPFTVSTFYFDASSSTFSLLNSPAGRIMALPNGPVPSITTTIFERIFTRCGLTADNLSPLSASAFLPDVPTNTSMLFYGAGLHTCAEALTAYATGTQSWYGFTAAGQFQYGRVKLPTSTPKFTFGSADSATSSMTLVDVIRPIDFTTAQVTYDPWFLTGGPLQSSQQNARQGYKVLSTYSYGAASIPLDSHPENLDSNKTYSVNLVTNDSTFRNQLITLYKTKLGIFSSRFRWSAIEVEIGDTISVSNSRYGWKVYSSSDPASPDNTATIDATLCVVIGKTVNLDGGSFPVQLDLMRPLPGYFPTGDLN